MPEPTLPQNQITQFRLACALGAIGGAIGFAHPVAALTGVIASAHHGAMLLQNLIWAGSGLAQLVLAILLWKGARWAFKPFAQVSVVLGFLFLFHSMELFGLMNFVPLVLLMMASSPEQSPRPTPVRVEPERRNREDRY